MCTILLINDFGLNLFLALEAVGTQVPTSDLAKLWQVVLTAFDGTEFEAWIHKLLLVQWTLWLSECQFEEILHLLVFVNHKVRSGTAFTSLHENLSPFNASLRVQI